MTPRSAGPVRYDLVALVSNDLVSDQRMQRSLTSLEEAGFECLLLGRERPGSRELDGGLGFAQERHRLTAHVGKAFYYQLNRAHYRRLLELRPRLILAVDLDTVLAARMAARQLKVPFVFDAHELFEDLPEVDRRPHIKLAWSVLGRLMVPRAAAAYTVGRSIAEILTERYGIAFGLVRNFPVAAPSPPVLRKRQPEDPFVILYQGALNEGRGLEELIEASTQLESIRVWIVGDGPAAQRLRAFAKTCSATSVTFYGELAPRELRGLTPRADLGYALMRNVGRNYYLSLSNKSLDYVQAGLPSLQMDWPEYRAIQEQHHCYHLVPELSVDAVVDAVRLCQRDTYHAQLRAACFTAAPHLTWASEAEVLVNTIKAVMIDAAIKSGR